MRGHNSRHYGEDDEVRSLSKEEKLRYANEALVCAKVLAACAFITKKEILGKRQGVRGFILRCVLEEWLVVRGCPKKYIAKLVGVARDVPGDDERKMWALRDNETIDADIHMLHGLLDQSIFASDSMDAIIARVVNAEPEEIEEEEPEPPPPPPPADPKKPRKVYTPGVDPKPEVIRRQLEAEALVEAANFKRNDDYLTGRMEHEAKLIVIGSTKKATKEQREEVAKAEARLDEYNKARKKLRRAHKASMNAAAI